MNEARILADMANGLRVECTALADALDKIAVLATLGKDDDICAAIKVTADSARDRYVEALKRILASANAQWDLEQRQ